MTQLFSAANCSQCGAPLDLLTLKCAHCGSQSLPINFGTAKPAFVQNGNRRQRLGSQIPLLDNIFLMLLQTEALAQGVEVTLTRKDSSTTAIYVTMKKSLKLWQVGDITIYDQGIVKHPWTVHYAGDGIFWGFGVEIGWEGTISEEQPTIIYLTADNLWHCMDDLEKYSNYDHEDEATFRNEGDLFLNYGALRTAAHKMIYFASSEIRAQEREQTRQKRIAQYPALLQPLASLFIE